MVAYKLHYFENKGAAEVARQLFALSEQKYEDIRYKREDWPKHKAEAPFGQVPYLDIDGKKLGQSGAINRFLARKFGYAGKSAFEEGQVDAIADQVKDMLNDAIPYFMVYAGYKPGDLKQLETETLVPARDKHFPIFRDILKKNKSGFVVGDSVTYADLSVAHFLSTLHEIAPHLFQGYPELEAHIKKIHSIPTIAKWIASRPKTKM